MHFIIKFRVPTKVDHLKCKLLPYMYVYVNELRELRKTLLMNKFEKVEIFFWVTTGVNASPCLLSGARESVQKS